MPRSIASLGVLLALTPACAYRGSARTVAPESLSSDDGWIAVGELPPVEQPTETDGGAAALAMVLGYWRQPTTITDVRAAYPALTRSGNTRADDLRSYALDRGFAAFLLRGELEILAHELGEGRPVIVGLIKRYGLSQLEARYQIVVGFHPARRLVVTQDPTTGWQENTLDGFLSEWEPSDRLTLVVIPRV